MKTQDKTNPLYERTINSNDEPWLTSEELYHEFIALQNGINTAMEEF